LPSQLPFYITGESYAGHYIPAVTTRILQGNGDPSWPKINLHAIAIGNGLVNPKEQYAQYLPYAAAMGVLSNEPRLPGDSNARTGRLEK
jgi:serine carboxypeptidase-like clade 4